MRAVRARVALALRCVSPALRWASVALLAGWLNVASASSCWASSSDPESTAAALALGRQGAAAYEAGQHAAAIEHFDRAFALLPAPSLQLWAARSCAQLGRLLEAQRRYRDTLSASEQIGDPAVQREAQEQARQELAELGARIPLLGVRVVGTAGQPARLTLDDRPFETTPGQLTPVDPGHHVLLGSHRGQHVSLAVDLAAGERRELVVEFSAPTASTPAPLAFDADGAPEMTRAGSAKAWRTAGWVGIGTGGSLLLAGIITRGIAQNRYDDLRQQPGCTRTQCPAELRDRVDSYAAMRNLSMVTTISGAVLGAAGAGLVLFGPRGAEAGLALSPAGVAWTGRF